MKPAGPLQGLFAFADERSFFRYQDQPDLDHAEWFQSLELPSHGPGYDAVLRGKVIVDPDTDQAVIGIYGAAYLSNRRFKWVLEVFQLDESQVVEKTLDEPY